MIIESLVTACVRLALLTYSLNTVPALQYNRV